MVGVQDGGMERQRNLILPERPQRGYWQFLYKYPSKLKINHGIYRQLEIVSILCNRDLKRYR
jgi:hypothetical protein